MPQVLVALANMVLEEPSVKNQSDASSPQAALSIAQLLKFNSVKQRQKEIDNTSVGSHKTQKYPSVRHHTT